MQNRRNELVEIETALSRADYDFIRRMAHTWKGICRPYGFVHLETLSKTLEGAGEREDRGEITRLAAEIRNYLDNVRIVYDS